ncbi:hypothetical protein [Aureibaculum conchae]|uniref:hypothetical protein n=1 Tax=Aureibaculum sp. 2308TA14-22 TaxID=3108392 RepID=UPI0033952324
MNNLSDKEKALKKLSLEIDKDIQKLIIGTQKCGLRELLYFLYYLHWLRLLHLFPRAQNEDKTKLKLITNSTEESFRYLISLISKFGQPNFLTKKNGEVELLNDELVQALLNYAKLINSKFETFSLIKLFDVQVSGERNQHLRIDMSKLETDPKIKSIFNYFLRTEIDNGIKKSTNTHHNILIENFKKEYQPLNDLFEIELGVTVNEFCDLIDKLLLLVTNRLKLLEDELPKLENGNVNIQHPLTFVKFSNCYLFEKKSFFKNFDKKFHKVIDRLLFEPSEFDEKELRFHSVTRKPLISLNEMIIISPELLLDGLFTNIHYSLIESKNIKQEYIKKKSDAFIDEILEVAKEFGFEEVVRELDLYEGKNQIGDLDLILKGANGDYLIIEAKNHALPLEVYFNDFDATLRHLEYLKEKWESKVIKRIKHLELKYSNYSITKNHLYIVVSLFPEVISHFSDLMILSIAEFKMWLDRTDYPTDFNSFYSDYSKKRSKFSKEEVDSLTKENLFFGEFRKE